MKFRSHGSNHAEQWQTYRQLEAIPESVPNPDQGQRWLTAIPNAMTWAIATLRPVIFRSWSEIEHIEHCWSLNIEDYAGPPIKTPENQHPHLWILDGNFESPVPNPANQKPSSNFKYGLINPDLWLT